ncbi:REP element-mobilizing transposase RayT [Flavobacterium endophyticum]|uniref:REP element-mobilizing transposase RayT n=1 Tax=Flavobacterium endophyticum TaxID=1540163 RepID=A0A495M514_9FLAO|nr:hypothetical protein [Flavobacterium endophyticum]RKS20415.1 REP element-mobilizing transposase RayT [Flavobacterium endophyticum]
MKIQPLEPGMFYHVYNRGNNGIDLFYDTDCYYHFLRLYEKYMNPVADTYAWCLLGNHFHLLVYIKTEDEIDTSKLEYSTVEKPKVVNASKQFSHLFNAYTQAINKRFKRTGSLFERPFHRKLVSPEDYFQKLIYYIHNNPVHHGFCKNISEYPWSSYGSIVSEKPTQIKRKEVIDAFYDLDNFIAYHNQDQNLFDIDNLIIE